MFRGLEGSEFRGQGQAWFCWLDDARPTQIGEIFALRVHGPYLYLKLPKRTFLWGPYKF